VPRRLTTAGALQVPQARARASDRRPSDVHPAPGQSRPPGSARRRQAVEDDETVMQTSDASLTWPKLSTSEFGVNQVDDCCQSNRSCSARQCSYGPSCALRWIILRKCSWTEGTI
jgi:hypothetical protein